MHTEPQDCFNCEHMLRLGTIYVSLAHRIEIKPNLDIKCWRWKNDNLSDDDAVERNCKEDA